MAKFKYVVSLSLTSLLIGCSNSTSSMLPDNTPSPTPDITLTSTATPKPTPTPLPSSPPKLTLSTTQTLDSPSFDPATPVGTHGALTVDGIHIKDSNNEVFQLRGVSTHGIQWFKEYTCTETFKGLRDNFKINAIRLALYADDESMYPENQDTYTKILEDAISNATSLGLYVIVDWHILADGNPMTNEDDANTFFKYFSTKYQNYPNIIFEICNEPNGSEANWDDAIKPYADKIISTIRTNSPTSIVIVGTPKWCQSPLSVVRNKITDPNVVYSFHFYADSHGYPLRQTLESAINKYQLPMLISEFGTCSSSGDGNVNTVSCDEWLECIDSYSMGWFIWNLSDKNESSSLLVPDAPVCDWDDSDLTQSGLYIKERLLNY